MYLLRDREKCVLFTALSFRATVLLPYNEITRKDSLLWSSHAPHQCTVCVLPLVYLCQCTKFCCIIVILLPWIPMSVLNSCRLWLRAERKINNSSNNLKLCLFYSAFLLFVRLFVSILCFIDSIYLNSSDAMPTDAHTRSKQKRVSEWCSFQYCWPWANGK